MGLTPQCYVRRGFLVFVPLNVRGVEVRSEQGRLALTEHGLAWRAFFGCWIGYSCTVGYSIGYSVDAPIDRPFHLSSNCIGSETCAALDGSEEIQIWDRINRIMSSGW